MLQVFCSYSFISCYFFPAEEIRNGYFYREEFYLEDYENVIENRKYSGVSMDIFRYNSNDQVESSMMNIEGTVKQDDEMIQVSFFIRTDLKLSLFGFDGKGFKDGYYFTRFKFRGPDGSYSDTCFGGFLFYEGYFRHRLSFKRDRRTSQEQRWIVKYGFTFFKKLSELPKDAIKKKIDEALKKMSQVRDKKRLSNLSDFLRNDTINKEELLKCEEEVFRRSGRSHLLESHIYKLVLPVLNDELDAETRISHHIRDLNRLSYGPRIGKTRDTTDFSNVLNLLYYYSKVIGLENDHKGDPAYSILPIYGKFRDLADAIVLRKFVYIDSAAYCGLRSPGIETVTFEFVVDDRKDRFSRDNGMCVESVGTRYYCFVDNIKPEYTAVSAYSLHWRHIQLDNKCCVS